MMKKQIWKSKTIWGALFFCAGWFLVNSGFVDASWFTTLAQAFGIGWGVYGVRDAM